jgi:glycosidase
MAVTGQAAYPALYEINTRVWLNELSRHQGVPATFDGVPDAALDRIAEQGFDWVWLMGVWQTGPAGRAVSRGQKVWRQEFQTLLADLSEEDICGSPFAIQGYSAHADFGGNEALLRLRRRLHERGLRLLLDFVPNHTALDHPWVWEHPEYYVRGSEEDLKRAPADFCRVETWHGPRILAHGRDPYFPGWPDTLQLNYRHAGARAAVAAELLRVADLCEGVRCDMAMLLLPDVFARTWGNASLPADGSVPVDRPFWPEVIARVRENHPQFLFLAEAYWDLEWALQQQGFDYTYDKRLYDRLHARDVEAVRGHLQAELAFQKKSVRFLENHDEPRAAGAFPPVVHRAAAVVAYLVPGMRLFHEGQLEGRRVRISMHLCRRPEEAPDAALAEFYRGLRECLRRDEVRMGRWQLLSCRPAWPENPSWKWFLAFLWEHGPSPGANASSEGRRLLVAVNYGPNQGQCYVTLPLLDLRGRKLLLRDLLSGTRYERDGTELANRGLYLDMPDWGYCVFEMASL